MVPLGLAPFLHLLVDALVDAIGLVIVLIVGSAGKQAHLVLRVLEAGVVVVVPAVVLLLVGAVGRRRRQALLLGPPCQRRLDGFLRRPFPRRADV